MFYVLTFKFMLEHMLEVIFETLWFFLPAIAANVAPVFAARYKWIPLLQIPLDGGKSFRGKRILGEHKTVRGLCFGLVFAVITGYLQYSAYVSTDWAKNLSILPYSDIMLILLFSAMLGAGALTGDAVKSFFKRQLNIPSGKSWPLFDQVDFVIGALLASYFFVILPIQHIITAFVVMGVGSYVVSAVGVRMKIKKAI